MDSIVLLQAVAGVARTVRSLYGPNKLRKQVTDELDQTLFSADAYTVASALQSQNAGTAILQQALDEQRKEFGTSCTTIVTLCGALADTVLELLRQGVPAGVIQLALSSVEKCCLTTAKHMRIPLTEAVPTFRSLIWTRQLEALGKILSTESIATSLAVTAASRLDPIRLSGAEDAPLSDLVTSSVVLGGVTSASSSQVFDGVLLPVTEGSPRNALRRRFSQSGEISITGGIVALAGDLDTLDFSMDASFHVIFVHGDVSSNVIDASVSTPKAPLIIPVSSYNALRQLAEISGAEIVDSWEELLPNAIGHESLQLNAVNFSVSKALEDDELATCFIQVKLSNTRHQPHTSVIVQGPTKSLAEELRNETVKTISRLRNGLRSGYVLPGNGGFWCACAAAVEQEATALVRQELLSLATTRLIDPLTQLGVILLENAAASDDEDDSFFSRLARVRTVQNRFTRSVLDVGASKFYSRYFDFRSAEYAVLTPKTTEPECEDGRLSHVDEYESMTSAIRKSFRVIQLLLSIDKHHVN
ncbi:TCP-1/cpn60 chaperonin family [Phytophthora infestans]|uniref:TCP-1/cpn60 chaperonin family n=1 Tax=Phytophthora infestans TaxID=4787 RepID=A0A8S9U2E3_PHYIN|nr:TCP-1/cpn60 chaperonin family [Phytophthora infestans]